MPPTSAKSALADTLLSFKLADEVILNRVHQIHQDLVASSPYLRQPNFTAIHPRDLEFLFGAYDERFFTGLCREALDGRRLGFRLSRRMVRTGGTTTRYRAPNGEVSYEIAIAGSMLFDGFAEVERRITVCGLECQDRLAALQRIFEHEMSTSPSSCPGNTPIAPRRVFRMSRDGFSYTALTRTIGSRGENGLPRRVSGSARRWPSLSKAGA